MIKVEANQMFTLDEYQKIKKTLISKSKVKEGTIYKGDIFECDIKIAKYLNGDNKNKLKVVDIIEVK